jgi:CheY-like chemotaxis protein
MKKSDGRDQSHVILVAEDDEHDIWMLRRACAKEKIAHTFRFVHDGEQALDYLQGNPPYTDRKHFPLPDLLVVDLKLPRFDGFDILQWIQNSPSLPDLPVVVLSGSDLDDDKGRAKRLGARAYYVKSGIPDEMQKVMLEICRNFLKDDSPPQDQPRKAA